MTRMMRDSRLIPIVLLATICLFALKVSGIVFDGGYTLAERLQGRHLTRIEGHHTRQCAGIPQDRRGRHRGGRLSWAQAVFNYRAPGDGTADAAKSDVTGSVKGGSGRRAVMPGASDDITYSSAGGE